MQDSTTLTPATPAEVTPPDAALSPNGASNADMLTQSEWTRRMVATVSMIVVGVSIFMIVGVMCYRVALDGNSALTNDITTKLMFVGIVCILSMVAALFGSNTVIAKVIDKLV